MKTIRKFGLLAAGAAVALAMSAAPGFADTAQATQNFAYDGADGGAAVSLILNPANPSQALTYMGSAGGFMGTLNGTPAIFWCSDLFNDLTTESLNYTVQVMVAGQTVTSSTGSLNNGLMTPLTTQTANQLNALIYNGQNFIEQQAANGTVFSPQNQASSALQLAIWAFLYNGNNASAPITPGSGSTLTVDPSMDGSLILDDANAFLNCTAGTEVAGYCDAGGWLPNTDKQVLGLYLPDGAPVQSMLTLDDVPEPASIALLGAGLVGLGVLRRRRG